MQIPESRCGCKPAQQSSSTLLHCTVMCSNSTLHSNVQQWSICIRRYKFTFRVTQLVLFEYASTFNLVKREEMTSFYDKIFSHHSCFTMWVVQVCLVPLERMKQSKAQNHGLLWVLADGNCFLKSCASQVASKLVACATAWLRLFLAVRGHDSDATWLCGIEVEELYTRERTSPAVETSLAGCSTLCVSLGICMHLNF